MLMWAVLCGLLIFEMIKYSKFLKKKSFETNLQNIATESFYCNVLQILYKGSLFTSRLGWRKSVFTQAPKNKHILKVFNLCDTAGTDEATGYPPGAVDDVRNTSAMVLSAM